MSTTQSSSGITTIAPEVLLSIARLTTLGIQGVNRLSDVPGGFDRLFKRGINEGVRLSVTNNTVYADIYVILEKDMNVREVSHAIQNKVARAISEMVGLEVGRVNIHVDDINPQAEAHL